MHIPKLTYNNKHGSKHGSMTYSRIGILYTVYTYSRCWGSSEGLIAVWRSLVAFIRQQSFDLFRLFLISDQCVSSISCLVRTPAANNSGPVLNLCRRQNPLWRTVIVRSLLMLTSVFCVMIHLCSSYVYLWFTVQRSQWNVCYVTRRKFQNSRWSAKR